MIVYDIQDIVKIYPGQTHPANDHITLQIQEGEIFGLLGDNGAGKTTLIRQMVNLLSSTAGRISLFGEPVGEDPLHVPLTVGYMPQDSLALNNLTVGEALYFTAHLRGMRRADAQQDRDRLLELWQLGPQRDQPNNRLSGGQRRLLRLAISMAALPPVLVLDEPTNDLDPQRRKHVWDVLRAIHQDHGTTIIFITHDAVEAEKIIQRVGIMRGGKLVALGRPSALKRQVDHKLRLELFCAPDVAPALLRSLPRELAPREVEAGRWITFVDWQDASAVLGHLDMALVDDFRFYSATLEDLYLHYANHKDFNHRDFNHGDTEKHRDKIR